jgi:hypothetical protein
MVQAEVAGRSDGTRRHRGRNFFVAMSAVLLAAVLVGFARTLYLRPFLGLPVMPAYLYVHGVVLTAWFLLLPMQVLSVRRDRTPLHRRVGPFGAVLAVAVAAISLLTLARRVAPFMDEAPFAAFGNLMSVMAFLSCVGIALLLRHRPEAHKRLMLLGSIVITGPALDRMARLPALANLLEPFLPDALSQPGVAFAMLATPSLMLAVVGYDLLTRRRPHPATLGGILAIFGLAPAVSAALMYSGAWSAFVRLVS